MIKVEYDFKKQQYAISLSESSPFEFISADDAADLLGQLIATGVEYDTKFTGQPPANVIEAEVIKEELTTITSRTMDYQSGYLKAQTLHLEDLRRLTFLEDKDGNL